MKILVVGRSYPSVETGMFGTFEYDQALVLHKAGQNVRFFFYDTRPIYRLQKAGYYTYKDEIISSGVYAPIGRIPDPLYTTIKNKLFKKYFDKVIREFQPDVVHIHYPSIILTAEMWNFIREHCKKVVLTEHFSKVMTGQLSEATMKELSRQYSQSDAVICVSGKLKEAVQRLCLGKSVDVVPNVISGEMMTSEREKNDFITFAYVGKIDKAKQVDVLIRAFSQAFSPDDKVRLNIVGSGRRKYFVKYLTRKLNIQDKVVFHGNVSRKRVGEILGESDYFVTATRLETFCVPIIEAWYCGLPVIIPDSIPILNYANDSNSLIFKDSDVEDLAKAMRASLSRVDGFDRETISIKAREIFGGESVSRQLVEIYQNIL